MKHETGAVLFTINLQSLATFYERVVGMRVLHMNTSTTFVLRPDRSG